MADDNRDDQDREDNADPTPEPTSARPRPGDKVPPRKPDTTDDADADTLKAEVERLRRETKQKDTDAKNLRLKLQDFERRQQEEEDAKLTEAERVKKAREEAEERARAAEAALEKIRADLIEERIDRAIESAAAGLMEYPDTAPRLIDRSRVEYDPDTGFVKGAKDAVERLLKDKPGLSTVRRGGGTPPRDTGPRRPPGGEPPPSPRYRLPIDPYEEELQEIRPVGRM